VPEDQRALQGGVRIIGSFNGWDVDTGVEMEWIATDEQYVAEVLLKQGQYEYRYHTRDGRMTKGTQPRLLNSFQAFVYYHDIQARTDRLLAFGGIQAQP
jgi:hypothetical protein